jgi:hypothetical protein
MWFLDATKSYVPDGAFIYNINVFNFDPWAFTSNSLGRSAATVLLIERRYDSNPI